VPVHCKFIGSDKLNPELTTLAPFPNVRKSLIGPSEVETVGVLAWISIGLMVHDWVVDGLLVVTPQLLESVTVLACWPLVQGLHELVCQLGLQTVHVCVVAGLPDVIPQLLESVTVLVCWPLVQAPHEPVCQFGAQTTVQDWLKAGSPVND